MGDVQNPLKTIPASMAFWEIGCRIDAVGKLVNPRLSPVEEPELWRLMLVPRNRRTKSKNTSELHRDDYQIITNVIRVSIIAIV